MSAPGWAGGLAAGPRVTWRTTMPRRQTMTTPDTTQPEPGPDPIGEAAHAVWDALDLAAMAASRDPDAPHTLETADNPIDVADGTWGILAVWGTTPVRITVEHARPEEAAALGMDGNAQPAPDPGYRPPSSRPPLNWDTRPLPRNDLLCVGLDDGTYQQPDPVPDPLRHGGRHGLHEHGGYAPHSHEVRPDHAGVPQQHAPEGR